MKRVSALPVLLFIVTMLSSACSPTATHRPAQLAEPSSHEQGVAQDNGDYIIGKGDVLEINVWREPMLSGETIVRNDGMISLPLLGDMPAAGHTTLEVKEEVQEGFKEFVSDPVVTVMLRVPASQRFYVLGEVNSPGEYDLAKDMTVVQAIARAGGFTEWASKRRIVVLRREHGQEKRIPVNYNAIMSGRDVTQNLLLRADDTIVVP